MRTAVVLLAAGLLAPASSDAAAPRDTGRNLVYLGPGGPVLVRLHLTVDGQPVTSGTLPWVATLFSLLDRDEDGLLGKDEAARVPDAQGANQLRLRGSLRATGGRNSVPLQELDTIEKDGWVTVQELTDYYIRAGLDRILVTAAPAIGVSPVAVNNELYQALDRNQDGQLSPDEVTAGTAALARLDEDDDEMITLGELARPSNGFVYGEPVRGGPEDAAARANLVLSYDLVDLSPAVVNQLMSFYDRNVDVKLSRKEAGLPKAVFDGLDANRDDQLDASELSRFGDRPTDLEFVVRLGKRESGETGLEFCGPSRNPLPLPSDIRRIGDDALTVTLKDTVLELYRQDGIKANYQRLIQSHKQMFQLLDANKDGSLDDRELQDQRARYLFLPMLALVDRDSDGRLTETEANAYYELYEQMAGNFFMVQVRDNSQGLFEMLDASRDGRISVRERRTAWSRIKEWDRNGDGLLARDEVPRRVQIIVSQGYPVANFGQRAQVGIRLGGTNPASVPLPNRGPVWFRKMDRNSDGDVSRREFLGSLEDFRRIDVDGDELIELAEAEAADKGLRAADAKP